MFDFTAAPVPVRDDLRETFLAMWTHISGPGPVFDSQQRSGILATARATTSHDALKTAVGTLASVLYADPSSVDARLVRAAAVEAGDPATVETIALVSMLASVDGTHRALGVDLEPLPAAQPGQPTRRIAEGLKRRRTHVPMPQGSIPVALDLLPNVGAEFRASFGALYMTEDEMALSSFERSPGLNRAQLELVAARTSFVNKCFY